ncbi:hypothetical protein IGI04_018072 [Brassica rapa subsp. trilocularis]|uniref:Uncharacterized protein n=1 Tax=Brassica rapa subsp. trilocularis TaxID=1813537 RepID=A0ABQ7MBW1_BRACM|nr:hypothetical protein IGI04_018072 [Brassica rapa subsp. trilocularis]
MTPERPLRATYQGRSRSRATRWSDCTKSLAFSRPETHNSLSERPLAATQRGRSRILERPVQSDREKSLAILVPGDKKSLSERPLAATQRGRSRSLERRAEVAARLNFTRTYDFSRAFWSFHYAQIHKNSLEKFISWEDPLAVNEVEGLEGQEELCFINNNGSWYKKEPNFQYNNYQQKSYPNNQQSGYPPRNNQQGSYQPQQNPSSGSSAPQESSTDTLLKQILESQTRSEKQVGYELKNLHSKIGGSYNELNNKFSHLASTLKRGEKVTIGRTEHGSDLPERHHEVAVSHFSERPS